MCLHTTNTADDIKTPASFEVRCACVCRISDDKLQKGVSHQHFHHMQRIDDREDKKKGQCHSSILLSATDAWKFGGDVCGEAISNIRNGIRLVLRENQHSKVMPKNT